MESDDALGLDTFLDRITTIQETAAETYCESKWSGTPRAIIACQEGTREWKTSIEEKIEFNSLWSHIKESNEVSGVDVLGLTSNNPTSRVYDYCESLHHTTFPCKAGADHASDLAVSTFDLEGMKQAESDGSR